MTLFPLMRPTAPDREVIPAKEYGLIDVAPADVLGSDGRLILTPGVLNKYVKADFKDNGLRLTARGVTGLIPLTDRLTVQVRPRFPLHNLTHMVSVCGYTPTVLPALLRDYKATDQFSDWMLDVMADALLVAFDTIRLNGLLRTYHRRTDDGSYPHGRINTTATILRHASRGINHRAEYSWFERTIDNAPNRCLKSAAAALHRRYLHAERRSGVRERVARLGEVLRVLQDVTPESRPFSLDDPVVRGTIPLPETRAYYQPALELAVAVLTPNGISLDAPTGPVRMQSLLVKTEDLFEEFVRLSLQKSLSNLPDVAVLDGNKDPGRLPLYEGVSDSERELLPAHEVPTVKGRAPEVNPDVVFRLEDGTHPLVADVKYTEVKDFADRSEVEQVVLYGVRYRSPVAITIHPRYGGAKKGLHVAGRIGSILVAQYRVDLGAEDLEAEMDEMAVRISELIVSRTPSPSRASGLLFPA